LNEPSRLEDMLRVWRLVRCAGRSVCSFFLDVRWKRKKNSRLRRFLCTYWPTEVTGAHCWTVRMVSLWESSLVPYLRYEYTQWHEGRQTLDRVTNPRASRSVLERRSVEGKRPVYESSEDSGCISQVAPDPGKPV
jgi:hypothetical protein